MSTPIEGTSGCCEVEWQELRRNKHLNSAPWLEVKFYKNPCIGLKPTTCYYITWSEGCSLDRVNALMENIIKWGGRKLRTKLFRSQSTSVSRSHQNTIWSVSKRIYKPLCPIQPSAEFWKVLVASWYLEQSQDLDSMTEYNACTMKIRCMGTRQPHQDRQTQECFKGETKLFWIESLYPLERTNR